MDVTLKKYIDDVKLVAKDVVQAHVDKAKKLNADIIVMGSHSRKWLESIILGSAAQDVLKKTTIPLFIVPTRKE